jgi:hypothetical protein
MCGKDLVYFGVQENECCFVHSEHFSARRNKKLLCVVRGV